ncbi:hypothetical protein ACFX2H_008595 [Malus domestica]
MPTTTRRKLRLSKVTVDMGCSCRKPIKLFQIFHPKPKPSSKTLKQNNYNHFPPSSSSSSTPRNNNNNNNNKVYKDDCAPFLVTNSDAKATRPVRGFGRIGSESVAVEKDSGDPYLDFRHSMLQMILENEIYSKDDLRELLNCFLQLNSPCNHGIIIRAFTEIWNAVFSVRSGGSTLLHFANNKSRDY